MDHLWDKLLKIVGDIFPNELVQFIFPDQQIKIQGKYEQEKVVIESQIADINFWILDQGVKKLLNIEPYSEWKKSIPSRVFTRNGIITKSLKYKHEVISVVVLLDKKSPTGKHRVSLAGQTMNYFKFPVVNLADVERILKDYPPLAPFVLKMDRSYKDRVLQTIKGNKILLYVTVLVLNRVGFTKEEALAMTGIKLAPFGRFSSNVIL